MAQYYDPRLGSEVISIVAGEFVTTPQPVIIATVLGSCVAVCLRDEVRGGGGMNHFMLPPPAPDVRSLEGNADSLRYGGYAMEQLINEFVKRGSQRADLSAKVFGGAAVATFSSTAIGAMNATFVRAYLRTEGIAITAADLGGQLPRRVLFFVATGAVRVQYLPRLADQRIGRGEAEYLRRLLTAKPHVDVDLF